MEDFLSRALPTLLGALFGTSVAFALAVLRERAKERKGKVERFKTALFILLLQRGFLRNVYAKELAPQRDSPIRNYSVLAILSAPPVEKVDVPALAFLLSGNSHLVNALMLAQEKYRTLVTFIEARNEVVSKFQARLEMSQKADPGKVTGTIDDLKQIAGPVIAAQLQQMTDALYSGIEDAIRFNRETLESGHSTFKKLFPKTDIFGATDVSLAELSKDSAGTA